MFIRSPQVCAVFAGRGGEGWGVRNKKRAYLCFFCTFNIIKLVLALNLCSKQKLSFIPEYSL